MWLTTGHYLKVLSFKMCPVFLWNMYYKSFKVNGQEDIDDFLLMVDETYYKYSELTRKDFFAQNSTKIFKTNIGRKIMDCI